MRTGICLLILLFPFFLSAQTSVLRGNVFDADTGEPVLFATVQLEGTDLGTNTDENGFFTFANIDAGTYTIQVSYLSYETLSQIVEVPESRVVYQRIQLKPSAIQLEEVNVSARRQQARTQVQVSKITVSQDRIQSLPSTGGEADIAQYLPVLPGIVTTGDQGGQLYIRGGSPVQNKVLLDGMTIFNPFHSIGFFSVFETETIRSVDVLTGGFNAEYGGRISAIVDIKTREGNKQRYSGLVSASPFQAKALLEGPIKKLDPETGNSISFMLTGKHSYLNETSKSLYDYAVDTSFYSFAAQDTSLSSLEDLGLPYEYTDLYGKLSFVGGNGSKLDVFGFHYKDAFDFAGLAALDWTAVGGGATFRLVPPNSNIIMDGHVSLSNYEVMLEEADGNPRSSAINTYSAGLNFNYFGNKNEINYGFEFSGFNTDFRFRNLFNLDFQQEDFTSEIAGFFKYKQELNKLIIEPGLRLQFYASQSKIRLEPRLGLKFNATDDIRFKAAGGVYSQNVISTLNDLDVVNFFNGFLAGPEETIFKPGSDEATDHRLQTAWHAVAGVEIDLMPALELNVEGYWKEFTQLITINRNKLSSQDSDFVTETGDAYGVDVSLRYEMPRLYLWATYSLGFVNRDDGFQEYPTVFDRRHNVNLLATYAFGGDRSWEAGLRWNYGSPFPFTQTQGFYQNVDLSADLLQTDVLTGNFPIGILLSEDRNGGRLLPYHRLDLSLKKRFELGQHSRIEATLSVTNAYDRSNIFYVDRLTNSRVDQLPILPSLAVAYYF